MTVEAALHQTAYFLATGCLPNKANADAADRLTNTLLWLHETGALDLNADLEILTERVAQIWEKLGDEVAESQSEHERRLEIAYHEHRQARKRVRS